METENLSGATGDDGHSTGIGWRFRAHLETSTPLAALQADGWIEHAPEPPDVGQMGGEWVANDSVGDGATRPSQFGPVPADGGEVLHFLIAFRTMVETGLDENQYKAAAQDIATRFPQLARMAVAQLADN